MASDPVVLKTLARLRRADPAAARLAQAGLNDLLADGGLADLTQHDLQSYLWFVLPDHDESPLTAAAMARFFEMAELERYAGIAESETTRDVLRAYAERGNAAGQRAATRAMDASGVVPPDLPELEWGESMGMAEMAAYDSIAITLELALATGDLKPGARGWRVAQARLTRIQLTMNRHDGPPLLERIRVERLEMWALHGGQARRALAGAALGQVASVPGVPSDVAERMEPMQWLLELANGRQGDAPGVPLTVAGNLARRVVQEAAERFNWWDLPERLPRSESDMWRLTVLRTVLSSAGAVRRVGRKLLLGTRGRALLGNPLAQWQVATDHLLADAGFDAAAQEAALLLLLQAGGMVEMRELVTEVADVLAGSGWRDTGDGSPPDDQDVSRAVWAFVRRCELWSLVDSGRGPGWSTRLRLSPAGKLGGYAALRHQALRARAASDVD
ncbi:hypothetical protein [Luedemannella flava]|uniref:hypothetical protein n=1 Tax=Luedemannella flava TaxID=349316 RepID=UPI0031D0DB5A